MKTIVVILVMPNKTKTKTRKPKPTRKVRVATVKGTTRRKNKRPPRKVDASTGPMGPRGYDGGPAFVNDMKNKSSGTVVTFNGASGIRSMKIRFRVGQVVISDGGQLLFEFTGGNRALDCTFDLVNSYYFPPYITNLIRLFEKWLLQAAVAEYEPRVNTSSTCSFTIAGSEDPTWPGTHGAVDGSNHATPTESQLSSLQDCCTVAAYRPCRLRLPVNKNEGRMLWTGASAVSTQAVFADGTDALIRQTTGAILMIAGVQGNAPNSSLVGDVYLNLSISLANFSTAITAPSFLSNRLNGSHLRAAFSKPEKSEKKNDLLKVPPIDGPYDSLEGDVPPTTLTKTPLVRDGISLWGRTRSPG